MTTTDEDAVRRYPELAGLVTLRDAKWRFVHHCDESGELTAIDGFTCWPHRWTDAITIKSSTNVLALRMTGDEPPGIVWQHAGALTEVVVELLALPAPDDRTAPRLGIGAAPRLWTPHDRDTPTTNTPLWTP
jgi:hypothetical protein